MATVGGPAVLAAVVGAFLAVTPVGPVVVDGYAAPLLAGQAFGVVAALLVVAAVPVARVAPGVATVLTLLPFAALPWTGWFAWGWLLALLAVTAVAAYHQPGGAVAPYVAALAVALVYCATDLAALTPIGPVTAGTRPGFQGLTFVLYALATTAVALVAGALGASARTRVRERGAEIQERHAREVEQLAQERARMARDLHDVVAHHVSLIAVRAESAPFQHPELDPAARQVLAEIATDARAAVGELRHALAVLRRTDVDDDPERAPQPAAADVDDLLAAAAGAGQSVRATGTWHDVPAAQGYVLYRAVQEGLTNARRHAPSAQVELRRLQDRHVVALEMANDAPGVGPAEPGRGLVGMRERVAAVGGRLQADVRDGRFVLRVEVPAGESA